MVLLKSLVRAKLINWHYFTNQTISFVGSTLITGENGSGKSTILDALQFALIGDQRKIRFNESAHSQSKRDLIGYLRCKTGSEESAYLRNGDFTSYVALEFFHAEKKISFVAGVVIDVYASGDYEACYFILDNCTIDDSLFLEKSSSGRLRPYGRKEFRDRVRLRRNARFFTTADEYRRNLLARFGHVSERFFSLITKGVAFQPITDIQKFVYDYVLDEKPLNVEAMLENFRHYQEYEALVKQTKEKIAALEPILKKHEEISSIKRTIEVQEYLILRARLEECEESIKMIEQKRLNRSERLSEVRAKLEDYVKVLEKLRDEEQELLQLRASKAVYNKKRDLERQKASLQATLSYLVQAADKFSNRCRKTAEDIRRVLCLQGQTSLRGPAGTDVGAPAVNKNRGTGEFTGLAAADIEILEKAASVFTLLGQAGESAKSLADRVGTLDAGGGFVDVVQDLAGAEQEIARAQESGLQDLLEQLCILAHEYLPGIQEFNDNVRARISALRDEKASLEYELDSLKKERRVYPENVQKLRDALAESGIEAKVLCELLEIRDPKWRNAVEGYLNTQRFDLLVEPDEFDEALSIYEREKYKRNISRVGLVNTGRVLEYSREAKPGSLAEEVESDSIYAKAYVARLLGNVMKCENEQEMKRFSIAITPTCMTYRNHTARQIPFEVYRVPYIGKNAISAQIQIKQQRLDEIQTEMSQAQDKLGIFGRAESVLRDLESIDRADELLELSQRTFQIPEVIRQLVGVLSELSSLDLSDLEAIEEGLKSVRSDIGRYDAERSNFERESGSLEKEIETLKEEEERLNSERGRLEAEIAAYCSTHPNAKEIGEKRYPDERRTKTPGQIIANFEANKKTQESRVENLRREVFEMKHRYNVAYRFGGDPASEDVQAYQEEHDKLVESELPAYEERIRKAKEIAEIEFKEHFIHRLKENIQEARSTIAALNKVLRGIKFGNDQYQFSIQPSRDYQRYYDMIMDENSIEGQQSLFSDVFRQRHGQALDELFTMIMDTDQERSEENIRKFTDYRTYLDYDIRIESAAGTLSFAKVCREKSGGETQTPFYVAIAASFLELYQPAHLDSPRLVIFDEAFNRMDVDRMENAMQFFRDLGLQVIAAVPTEKCELLVRHVDSTIVVFNNGRKAWVTQYELLREKIRDEGLPKTDTGQVAGEV